MWVCKSAMVIIAAIINVFGVISIHKTRKGAEMAIDFHKNEEREEYERVYKGIPESQRVAKFDAFKSWIVESFELTE